MSVSAVTVVPSMIVTVTSDECRSTKPLSSVWQHFTATKSDANKKLACCNYCRKELYPHCDRMKRHLQICTSLGNDCKNNGVARSDYLADVLGSVPCHSYPATRRSLSHFSHSVLNFAHKFCTRSVRSAFPVADCFAENGIDEMSNFMICIRLLDLQHESGKREQKEVSHHIIQ